MPKPKPDQIVRHEIVLGRADRELLDTAVTAYTEVFFVCRPIDLVNSIMFDPPTYAFLQLHKSFFAFAQLLQTS